MRFCEVPHYTLTHAVELSSNGSRFTFGADCSPNDELVRFARGHRRADDRGHAAAARAHRRTRPPDPARGRRAWPRAGARRLVLTHYSDEMDPDWARAEAADAFGGPVELAGEGEVYTV